MNYVDRFVVIEHVNHLEKAAPASTAPNELFVIVNLPRKRATGMSNYFLRLIW
jgi:hypothetical protein